MAKKLSEGRKAGSGRKPGKAKTLAEGRKVGSGRKKGSVSKTLADGRKAGSGRKKLDTSSNGVNNTSNSVRGLNNSATNAVDAALLLSSANQDTVDHSSYDTQLNHYQNLQQQSQHSYEQYQLYNQQQHQQPAQIDPQQKKDSNLIAHFDHIDDQRLFDQYQSDGSFRDQYRKSQEANLLKSWEQASQQNFSATRTTHLLNAINQVSDAEGLLDNDHHDLSGNEDGSTENNSSNAHDMSDSRKVSEVKE